jgi:cytochrome P450
MGSANAKFPPGPTSWLGGLNLIGDIQRDFIAFARKQRDQFGDTVSYSAGGFRIFQFTHPDQIYEVLVEHNRSFRRTDRMRQVLSRWNGKGLVVNDGDPWARQRRLVQPAFHPRRVDSYAPLVVRNTRQVFEPLAGQEIDIAEMLNRLTFRTVSEALFGTDVHDVVDKFLESVATLQREAIGDFTAMFVTPMWWPTPSRGRLRRAVKFMDGFVRNLIKERRATGEDKGDLLSMLLLAVDQEQGTGQMTDEQVRDEAVGLLLGGNETTATALTWTAYLLARDEGVQDEVQQEVDHVGGGKELTAAHVQKLALTTAVIKEAMRLYPPVYVLTRQAAEEVQIGPWQVPRGSMIHLPLVLTHRDRRFFDRPDDFVPHRFLNDGEKSFARGAYIPFGAGPRACIGRGFAQFEGTLILATLLQRFSLSLRGDQGEPEQEAQVSLHPKGGLQITLQRRQ